MSNYIEVDGLRVDPCMWRSKVEEVEQLRARVAELCDLIKYAQENSGVCMCGDDIKDHNQSSGHPPVDVWDHAVEQVDQGETSEALILRKQAEAVQASRRAISSCSEIPNSSGHACRQAVSVPDAWCVVTNDDQIQYTAMVDKNLGLPIEQSHDYAWQQCNEVIQEWIELGLDAASKYVIRPIALLATPTKADDWIKCSDRLPNLGQRVILKSRGVVQNYMPVFDQGDDDRGMGDHFWDFEDVNKIDNPLVDFEKDCWMPKPEQPKQEQGR